MKITHVKSRPTKVINVVEAAYVDGYRLQVTFDDGVTRVIDFEPFLRQARNPMTTKYLDPRKFKQFKIDWGNLTWNDREMIFPIMDLYRGTIEFEDAKQLNGHSLKTEKLSVPALTLRRFRSHAKKEDVPIELLAQKYLEEGMKRHGKGV